MSQSTEKSLGQVAYEAAHAQPGHQYVWANEGPKVRAFWDRSAQAVAAVVREQAAQLADAERAEFLEQSAMNNSRQSDMAFGSVCSSERIAAAIRSMK